MPKRKYEPVPDWRPSAMLQRKAVHHGRALLLTLGLDLDTGKWFGFAAETAEENLSSIDRVLESHAHDTLQPRPTLGEALSAADLYVEQWIKRQKPPSDCSCEPITKPSGRKVRPPKGSV